MSSPRYDLLVIGSGPAGQKGAIQAAKFGKRTAMVEQEKGIGGSCVYQGTIPSKTLRETALRLSQLDGQSKFYEVKLQKNFKIGSLMGRLEEVITAHRRTQSQQLGHNGVDLYHGRAHFTAQHTIQVTRIDGSSQRIEADHVLIATGSRPRDPKEVPVDHETFLDSDSILSMVYLPQSLTVLGGGVIACEYASIFSALDVAVTIVDSRDRPLGFVDPELTTEFLAGFQARGGTYLGNQEIRSVRWDGGSTVRTELEDGSVVEAEKMLVALGRVANLERLNLDSIGLEPNPRGHLDVNESGQTKIRHIYAAGDVVGPPSLAATAMEQGRRAACHMFGVDETADWEAIPIGIYTIPEMASIGLGEEEGRKQCGGVLVGRSYFRELARGRISKHETGLLKMVADRKGREILGVHIVGEGATELIHIAQLGMVAGCDVHSFVERIFNFPTLAEAYRDAALDILNQATQLGRPALHRAG